MVYAEPPVRSHRYSELDIKCAKRNADDNEKYFQFVQKLWHDHQVEASRQSAAIVRRVMRQQNAAA